MDREQTIHLSCHPKEDRVKDSWRKKERAIYEHPWNACIDNGVDFPGAALFLAHQHHAYVAKKHVQASKWSFLNIQDVQDARMKDFEQKKAFVDLLCMNLYIFHALLSCEMQAYIQH